MSFEIGPRVPAAHSDAIWAVCWCRQAIVTGGLDAKLKVWQPSALLEATRDAPPTPTIVHDGHSLAIVGLSVNPSATIAASSSMDGTLITYDLDSAQQLKKIEVGPTRNWSLSLSDSIVATGGHHGAVALYNYHSAESIAPSSAITIADPFVLSLQFNQSGDRLAIAGSKGQVALVDPGTGQHVAKLDGHTKGVRCVMFAATDGNVLLTGSEDHSIGVFDIRISHQIGSIAAHRNWVMGLASQHDQSGIERFASCSTDKTVKIWELRTRQVMHTFDKCHMDQVTGIAFSPFGDQLVSVSDDASIQFYNLN